MHVVGMKTLEDVKANTSAVIRPGPGAVEAALDACHAFRRREPAHVQWLLDGHPTLTHEEHIERFGKPYDGVRANRDQMGIADG